MIPTVAQQLWFKRNAPIIIQPEHDCVSGNSFITAFVHFYSPQTCRLSLVYESEASYHAHYPLLINSFGTFAYRTYNHVVHGRTADINHFAFQRCDDVTFDSIHTCDGSGLQTWSHGDKLQFLYCYSLVRHYDTNDHRSTFIDGTALTEQQIQSVAADAYHDGDQQQRLAHLQSFNATQNNKNNNNTGELTNDTNHRRAMRPLLFINTNNHLCAPYDTNPLLKKRIFINYPIRYGDRNTAECWSRDYVRTKHTLLAYVPRFIFTPKVHLTDEHEDKLMISDVADSKQRLNDACCHAVGHHILDEHDICTNDNF